MKSKIEALLCKNSILEQLISIPFAEILTYSRKADSVDPEEALRYLAEMYIDNCGVSTGLRSFADYCSVYWIRRLKNDDNAFRSKYGEAETLPELLPFLSDNYTEEIDRYDICFMTDVDLRDLLVEELQEESDERVKIILCAGICDFLSDASDCRWMSGYEMEKIEEAIVHLNDKSFIQYRHDKEMAKYRPLRMSWTTKQGRVVNLDEPAHSFSEEEVLHFEELNSRLVALQQEVMKQVREITLNLQEQIANGYIQYKSFNVEGFIYVENEDEEVDSLLNTLASHAKYNVMTTNDRSTPEVMDKMISMNMHWYSNWSGIFHQLEKSHGIKLCLAFRYLFEDAEVFTISDIMKISPDMLWTHTTINI